MIPTQKNVFVFLCFSARKNVRKILYFFSNLYAMHVVETLLPFSLLFSLKVLLFSITTLSFWVASESHSLFLLTAKSLSSKSSHSSSKKNIRFC